MRRILSAVLSVDFAANAAAQTQSPCDTLADAINKSQEAGKPIAAVAKALLETRSAYPGIVLPRAEPANLRIGNVTFDRTNGGVSRAVPHVTGLRFAEMREGSLRCQAYEFYRVVDGVLRVASNGDFDETAHCWPNVARPMGIDRRAYLAEIDASTLDFALRRITRGGLQKPVHCRVTIEARVEGRVASTDTPDAAAAQALRIPMAELERVLPDLAGAFFLDHDWTAPGFQERERKWRQRVLEFPAGPGRYVATMTEAAEGRPSDGISVRVARLFPELGNRAREIGGFVYAGEIRFVRALAQPSELR
ncbi:MAG: hypothetical protein IBJ15_08820 [Alphaproteobacteria bacterium]|nr:hypothetical protein [Alphaproteobacteria bacterium]